jgi:glycerol kinase
MSDPGFLLAIDQGTTSTRAILFDDNAKIVGAAGRELKQFFPADGWVEHDPKEIWRAVLDVCREVMNQISPAQVAAIGITNQRETTVVWDRETGEPIYRAIVWQDRRTADLCARLKADGLEDDTQARTGLLLDPYFSGTKLAWILDEVEGARTAAESGRLAFGTIDSWLIWNLTGGKAHRTDATNASRTLLFNLAEQNWDDEMLARLNIPGAVLPDVLDCCADFGSTEPDLFGAAISIAGVAGDQHAATVGQACFSPGLVKSTYGTGCFAVVNAGDAPVISENRLLGTMAYRVYGKPTYALEGSIFMAGATIQWMRDDLKAMKTSDQSASMASNADPNSEVYMVPAFTGLGAPYWDPHARGAILGMTRNTGLNEIVRAGIDSVCYQTRDLMEAMAADLARIGARQPEALRVDGGMVANEWFLQRLADILGRPIERAAITETTALGAAFLAGLGANIFESLDQIEGVRGVDGVFTPQMDDQSRAHLYDGWKEAVSRVLARA